MSISIVPILSTSHARALAQVKIAAFRTRSLYQSIYPVDNAQLLEDWCTAREETDLKDPKQKTFAIVKEVGGTADDYDAGCCIDLRAEAGEDVSEKRYCLVLAWARWLHPLPQDGKDGEVDSAHAKVTAERDRLLRDPASLPDGTNLELHAAFHKSIAEGKRKNVDEKKDWVLELLCTNPLYERQGHAKRLLEMGVKLADTANARVYLEATQTAKDLYARVGWKEISELEWTLADYGVKGDGDRDGKLVLTLMIREPALN